MFERDDTNPNEFRTDALHDDQIKQASDEAMVDRRRFQGHGDHMDYFQNNFFLNGFVVKEVSEAPPTAGAATPPLLSSLHILKSRV